MSVMSVCVNLIMQQEGEYRTVHKIVIMTSHALTACATEHAQFN